MKIVIAAPTHISFIRHFLSEPQAILPEGYNGAPFVGSIIDQLLQKGHEVIALSTSACIDGDYSIKEFTNKNFKWIVIPLRNHSFRMNNGKPGRMIDFFRHERQMMVSAINYVKPDVVHAHWSYEYAGAAIKARFPYLITVHDLHWKVVRFMPNLYRLFRAIMAEKNLSKLKHVTTVSPYTAKYLDRKVDKVVVVPNPIKITKDKNAVRQMIESRLEKIDKPKIIMINNGWKGLKNGYFGLQIFKFLRERGLEIEMHLVGDGTEYGGQAFKDARKLGIVQWVTFHGKMTNEKLLELFKSVHLLLHTSKEETFGVVLGEAGSMGVPALGYSGAGAVPWVIGEEALLFKNWNPEDVGNQIANLLHNKEIYRVIALDFYNRIEKSFSVERVVGMYEELYKSVANS